MPDTKNTNKSASDSGFKLLSDDEIEKLDKKELIRYICQLQRYSKELDSEEQRDNFRKQCILITANKN